MKIKPKKYRWKDDKTNGKKKYGVVAQNIVEALKECNCNDYDGLTLNPPIAGNADTRAEDEDLIEPQPEHYSMSTMPLVSTLIKAVQEQQTQITRQQEQIETLMKAVGKLTKNKDRV
jgi:hypothetical protein